MLPKAVRMLRRAEFVQATRIARAVATPYFIVQKVPDNAPDLASLAQKHRRESSASLANRTTQSTAQSTTMALGITASRKVGNAVARNRAKRRLRALLYQTCIKDHLPSRSHSPLRRIVLVARFACLDADFATMRQQLEQALLRSKPKTS